MDKNVLLRTRAVVVHGCLFSDLRYIYNLCTQVADIFVVTQEW